MGYRLGLAGIVNCNLVGLGLKLSSRPTGTSTWAGCFFRGGFGIDFFNYLFLRVRRTRRGMSAFDRFGGCGGFIRFEKFNLLSEWGYRWNRKQ